MRMRIGWGLLLLMVGWATSNKVWAQNYRERQLHKLYLQKTQKPIPAEKMARQKKWDQLRATYDQQQRLRRKQEMEERLHLGRRVATKQAHPDPLHPLKQQGRLGIVLHVSSIATQEAVDRKRAYDFVQKKSRRYKFRNRIRPNPPIFRIQLRQR